MSNKLNYLYEFEDFRLDAENPTLRRDGKLVSITPKALETLILLVEKNGETVSRDELLDTVWKDTYVDESNINYTISLLRKTLGSKDFIETVPKRGYRFAADVKKAVPNGDASTVKPLTISAQPESKKRPVLFAASIIGILLFGLMLFAWRSESKVGKIKESSPQSEESLRAYKRGKMILDDRDAENRGQKALDEFQQAVTLDPTSALAYTGLAEAFLSKAVLMSNNESPEFYAGAKAATDKAFALDDNLFEAFLVRGWLKRNKDWDWSGAETDLQRAIELKPDSGAAHYRYSQLLAGIGRHSEAIAEINKAAALDPFSEMIISGYFPLLESAGQFDEGLKLAEKHLQTNSKNLFTRRALAIFQYHTGDYAKVIENGEIALAGSKTHNFAWLSLLAAAYTKTGQPQKADEMLKKLEIQSHTDKKALYSLAMNYAELGHTEEALTALEKCYEVHVQRMIWVAVEPRFANLRNEPRFRELLGKMRLN